MCHTTCLWEVIEADADALALSFLDSREIDGCLPKAPQTALAVNRVHLPNCLHDRWINAHTVINNAMHFSTEAWPPSSHMHIPTNSTTVSFNHPQCFHYQCSQLVCISKCMQVNYKLGPDQHATVMFSFCERDTEFGVSFFPSCHFLACADKLMCVHQISMYPSPRLGLFGLHCDH